MPRVKVYRTLPPLSEFAGNFQGFSSEKSRLQTLTETLRELARKSRKAKPVPFYSMRQTAAFFGVPLSTANEAYKALEREGLLNRLRSSQTVLTGKAPRSRDVIRGVVGLPVWLRSMLVLPYTPVFVMEMEERLREAGYVADIIFHSTKEEETGPDFAARLLRHRLDAVVLQTPLAGSRQNILSLRERGARVFVIQRSEAPCDLPAVIYVTDYRAAYEDMARSWRKAGIGKVWLWSPPDHLNYRQEADLFRSILRRHGLAIHTTLESPRLLLKRIRREPAGRAAVAFLDTTHSEEICNREPHIIALIARTARLAFCVGTVNVPYLRLKEVRVDIVGQSPGDIARRVAGDISRANIIRDGVKHSFEAIYQELGPFGDPFTR